jgi:hypothetical protein
MQHYRKLSHKILILDVTNSFFVRIKILSHRQRIRISLTSKILADIDKKKLWLEMSLSLLGYASKYVKQVRRNMDFLTSTKVTWIYKQIQSFFCEEWQDSWSQEQCSYKESLRFLLASAANGILEYSSYVT